MVQLSLLTSTPLVVLLSAEPVTTRWPRDPVTLAEMLSFIVWVVSVNCFINNLECFSWWGGQFSWHVTNKQFFLNDVSSLRLFFFILLVLATKRGRCRQTSGTTGYRGSRAVSMETEPEVSHSQQWGFWPKVELPSPTSSPILLSHLLFSLSYSLHSPLLTLYYVIFHICFIVLNVPCESKIVLRETHQ